MTQVIRRSEGFVDYIERESDVKLNLVTTRYRNEENGLIEESKEIESVTTQKFWDDFNAKDVINKLGWVEQSHVDWGDGRFQILNRTKDKCVTVVRMYTVDYSKGVKI